MAKSININNTNPVNKSSYSSGTRGESAGARNKSGNHTGNRAGTNRGRGVKWTRVPKSF